MLLNIDTLGGTEICNEIEAAAHCDRLEVSGLRWGRGEKRWVQDDPGVTGRI